MPEDRKRTPTDVVISCLEEFGTCEPTDVVVVYMGQDKRVRAKSSCSKAMAVWMMEVAKQFATAVDPDPKK